MTTKVKTPAEIIAMRESGQMLAAVLKAITSQIKPGMSTLDLSRLADKELATLGGKPAFKGYQGFPEGLCVSVNEEVVHGIPYKDHIIEEGDIVSCDFGVLHKGMITDAAVSVIVGQPRDAKDLELVNVTKKAMLKGIEQIRGGVHTGDIGAAIQRVLDGAGFGIVREFVGHGVGHEIHEEPGIANYGQKGTGFILQPGMTVAIEPMATKGHHDIYIADDGWTVKTRDHARSAHFEHTVLVTEDGYEILTA
jgi:methionyl aminopeptidase